MSHADLMSAIKNGSIIADINGNDSSNSIDLDMVLMDEDNSNSNNNNIDNDDDFEMEAARVFLSPANLVTKSKSIK